MNRARDIQISELHGKKDHKISFIINWENLFLLNFVLKKKRRNRSFQYIHRDDIVITFSITAFTFTYPMWSISARARSLTHTDARTYTLHTHTHIYRLRFCFVSVLIAQWAHLWSMLRPTKQVENNDNKKRAHTHKLKDKRAS